MKVMMTIAYENSLLHFHPATPSCGMTAADVPTHYRQMDDQRLDDCFDTLCAGRNVWVWTTHSIKNIYQYLTCHYQYVKAAGGLVTAPDGQYLMITREGHWDLPKGMVETGESLAETALREVQEETGIGNLTIEHILLKTYHIYNKYGGWHLKQTSWFAMHTMGQPPTATPQTDEGITAAVWVSEAECRQRMLQSFASLRLLAKNTWKQNTCISSL